MSREYDSTYEGQLQKCGDERSALEQTVDDLSEENQQLRTDLAHRTAERDEARRDLCNLIGGFDVRRSRRAAKLRGWDCFDAKEAKP
jgi:hypothetical protein